MKQEQKEQIKDALMRYAGNFNTQQAAAKSLQCVSAKLLSQIKNEHWEMISETQWQNIARQVGFYCGAEWKAADTSASLLLRILFNDAQYNAMAYGVAMNAGIGKTFSAKQYARENDYAYYIPCTEDMNRKTFLSSLLQHMDMRTNRTVEEMLEKTVARLKHKREVIIILDDAQKLKDRVLQFAATLYKHLAGRCGIVILGNDELRSRIIEGVRMNKEGYEEIYKCIGRRFVTLGALSPKDVELVCRTNGISDEGMLSNIKDTCGQDLHKVSDWVLKVKQAVNN